MLDTLEAQTTDKARVLFETSFGRIHDGGHMAGYYAQKSGREFIGGPYPFWYFTGFWDGFVFGSPIENISTQQFLEYLELYNIGWIMVHSEESKAYLGKFRELQIGPKYRELQLYKVARSYSYFVEGEGKVVERGLNYLKLSNIDGESVTLKYHYLPGLTFEPSVEIVPVYLQSDPMPFIKINNPPAELVITLGN